MGVEFRLWLQGLAHSVCVAPVNRGSYLKKTIFLVTEITSIYFIVFEGIGNFTATETEKKYWETDDVTKVLL